MFRRLNIVNETLSHAAVDLFHFTLSFMVCFFCFAVMGCCMFGFKMTEFKTITHAFHTLFNMSIGDTSQWEQMRLIHPFFGMVYQYVFFLFMGFTMINIFLAIIMDSYAEVVGEARAKGAHTINHDIIKARQVLATHKMNPFSAATVGKGTRVNYKAAAEYAKDPIVVKLTESAADGEDMIFTPDMMKTELRPELIKFMSDTYSRLVRGRFFVAFKLLPGQTSHCVCLLVQNEGEEDAVATLRDETEGQHVENLQKFNMLESKLNMLLERIPDPHLDPHLE